MKIVLLHDAIVENPRPDELDNLDPIESDGNLLREAGHKVELVPLTFDFKRVIRTIRKIKPDFAFNFVESLEGMARLNHLAPMVLELAGVPYSGCSEQALYVTTDKLLTKQVLQAHGLPFPALFEAGVTSGDKLFIVKSRTEDASVGITQGSVVPVEEVQGVIQDRQAEYGGHWFAEEYIGGREFNLGLLADGANVVVLPVAEIVFQADESELYHIVGYYAKWQEDHPEYENSQRVFVGGAADRDLVQRLKKIALRCWDVFKLSGYARVDFRVDENNQPLILEINCNPGLDTDSGFVAGCLKLGMSYQDLLLHMLKNPRLPVATQTRIDQTAAVL